MRYLCASLVSLALLAAGPQHPSRPEVPAKLAVPGTDEPILLTHATGVQIYVCQEAPPQKFTWIYKAPEATLVDRSGAEVGTHYAGPTWKYKDGSAVVGKLAAREDAPEANAVPWLLVSAASHSGSGTLAAVTFIQRIHTSGGQPPATGCDAAHLTAETKVPYSADYYFYAPR